MKNTILLSLLLFFILKISVAQISGKVFLDANGDGIQQTVGIGSEAGIEFVQVDAYNAANILVTSTVTNALGDYLMPYTSPVRIEFILPNISPCFDNSTIYSGLLPNGENIRFINTSTNNLNYAVQKLSEYILNYTPNVFFPAHKTGDPQGTASNKSIFFGYPYNATTAPTNQQLAFSQIGCTYGVAYSKQAQKIFSSAFIKRHAGLGTLGSGGIYILNYQSSVFSASPFYNMDANGHRTRAANNSVLYGLNTSYATNAGGTNVSFLGPVDPLSGEPEGLGVVGVNGSAGRNLDAPTNDGAVLDQVGKVGLGDLDITEDGKFLYVTNLYSKLIYRLELDNVLNPTQVIKVDSFALPPIVATNGVLRPFALSFHKGKIFVGAVATGENNGFNNVNGLTNLYAYVFEITEPMGNPVVNQLPVLTIPLNYLKGKAQSIQTTQWFPWNNDAAVLFSGNDLPTPVLSDIDFTDNGDMILDFFDRTGHQFTSLKRKNVTGNSNMGFGHIAGDILIAGYNCNTGSYLLENNGSYISQGTVNVSNSGVGNNEGLGGGEFFGGDSYYYPESSIGSLAFIPKQNVFIATKVGQIIDAGTALFSVTDGSANSFITPTNSEYQKINALGDIEASGDAPEIQIGNRVWNDANHNGIQDVGELGIVNVTIELYADFNKDSVPDGAVLASTQSASDGTWIFDDANVVDGDPICPGNQAGPNSYLNYIVLIGAADWASGNGINDLAGKNLTLQDVGGNGQADVRDNDAFLLNGIPAIIIQTGMTGNNNHSYDFGFNTCTNLILPQLNLSCSQLIDTLGSPLVLATSYSWTPSSGLNFSNIPQPIASPSATTIYTLTIDGNCIYTQEVQVIPSNVVGPPLNIDCDITSVKIGNPAIPGAIYNWQPPIGLNATNIAQPIAFPSSSTTYSLSLNGFCNYTQAVLVDNIVPLAVAGTNKNIDCNVTSVVIGTPAIVGYSYKWEPSISLNNSTIAQPTANPNTTTIYTLTVTSVANGCSNISQTTVIVDQCCTKVVIPNSFTPNDDKLNDTYGIIEISNAYDFVLKLFNRFGEQVFETNDKIFKWDGKYKNKIADVGTYFYLLVYKCGSNGEKKKLQGDFILLR